MLNDFSNMIGTSLLLTSLFRHSSTVIVSVGVSSLWQ